MKSFRTVLIAASCALLFLSSSAVSFADIAPIKVKAKAKVKPTVKMKKIKYKVVKGKSSSLKVDIYHPAKHVVTKSKKVRGMVSMFGSQGTIKLSGTLSVRIKSLRSGNRRRDRVTWTSLGKSRQPYIYFYPSSMTLKGSTGTLQGTFHIRKKKKKVTMKIVSFKGKIDGKSTISVTVTGKIKCSDFKVKRPSLLFVKIKDLVDLTIKIKLKPLKS